MKGRALILIFLFLSVFIFINPVCAETYEDSFVHIGDSTDDYDIGYTGSSTYTDYKFDSVSVNNIVTIKDMKLLSYTVDGNRFSGSRDSEYNGVTLTAGGNTIGSGIFGDNYNPDKTTAYVHLFVTSDGLDIGSLTGAQEIVMSGNNVNVRVTFGSNTAYCTSHSGDVRYAFFEYQYPDKFIACSDTDSYNIQTGYVETFNFNYSNDYGINRIQMDRNVSLQSKVLISTDGYEVYNETSLKTTKLDFIEQNYTWYITNENIYGNVESKTLVFGDGVVVGDIEFNQSFYTDPEHIAVEWDITDFNSGSYNYLIQMTATLDGDVSGNFWEAQGSWNTSQYISSASGAAVFDMYSEWYDLPVWIQAELWVQDKSIGTWIKVDNTPAVIYHESVVLGQIWTDKSNYNVTELVEISYTTAEAENFIFVEEPNSYWVTYDVLVGTYSFFYELSTSAVGNTTIYLSENDVRVDQVTISVSSESGDDAYVAWMADYYYEGEMADFYYYSSNTSAQITVYDGADVVVFGPATTQLGYHNGMVNTANTIPGTFLVSLYHNGTYYNDTTMVTSTSPIIRFDSSVYEIGDTIGIGFFLPRANYEILLFDANAKQVAKFEPQSFGSYQAISFSLIDNNEYGYDMIAAIDAGTYATGYWTVWVIDQDGTFVEDGTVWDRAKVSKSSGDPADTSNEMISIFFSLEGIFLIFTAVLTVLGLAVTKHPGGGAACAVVGVGFGVFFKVLPVWMLLLMVITLVVLAGVSVAVYFRGK